MHFNGRFVINLAEFAARQGGNMSELVALSGKSAKELAREECFVEPEAYNKFLEAAVKSTGDSFLGLHAGESLSLSAAGLIAQITQTSETVKQALEYCCEFANLGCSALPMELKKEVDHYKVTLTPNELWKQQSGLAVRHTAEGALAFTVREFQSLTLKKHRPLKVQLSWPKPHDISEYERIFECPVEFEQDEIAILLREQDVEEKVITSDYNLLRILVAHAEEKSARIEQKQGFASLVKQSVVRLVKPEFPTIEQVAGHLNLSLRTLQRRLKEEGFTYKQLIDELKKEFALGYLKRPDLSINDIAYLLSYADTSAFIRSFKRWTNQTPAEYRSLKLA